MLCHAYLQGSPWFTCLHLVAVAAGNWVPPHLSYSLLGVMTSPCSLHKGTAFSHSLALVLSAFGYCKHYKRKLQWVMTTTNARGVFAPGDRRKPTNSSCRRWRPSLVGTTISGMQPIHCTLNGYQAPDKNIMTLHSKVFSRFMKTCVSAATVSPGIVLNSYCWWSGQQLWHSTHFNSLTCVVSRYLAHSYGWKSNRYCLLKGLSFVPVLAIEL